MIAEIAVTQRTAARFAKVVRECDEHGVRTADIAEGALRLLRRGSLSESAASNLAGILQWRLDETLDTGRCP